MTVKTNNYKAAGYLFAFISALSYGTLPVFSRLAHTFGFSGYIQVMTRSFFGMIFLAATILIMNGKLTVPFSKLYKWIILGILHTAASVTLFMSFKLIPIGIATTIHFTYPVIVTLFAVLFLNEKAGIKLFSALILSIAGMALLVIRGDNGINLTGVLLSGISGIVYSGYIIGLDLTGAKNENNFKLTFFMSLTSFVILAFFTGLAGRESIINVSITLKSVLVLMIIGLLGSYIALITFQKGVKFIGASRTSIISSTEPVISIFWGTIIFHETLTMRSITGIVFILLATLIVILENKK